MDVTTMTSNNIPVQRINHHNNIDLPRSGAHDTSADRISSNTFDYSKVMMDLREVQEFLFMLIGSKAPGKTAGAEKGAKVNLFA